MSGKPPSLPLSRFPRQRGIFHTQSAVHLPAPPPPDSSPPATPGRKGCIPWKEHSAPLSNEHPSSPCLGQSIAPLTRCLHVRKIGRSWSKDAGRTRQRWHACEVHRKRHACPWWGQAPPFAFPVPLCTCRGPTQSVLPRCVRHC